jgi:hypothetical protein
MTDVAVPAQAPGVAPGPPPIPDFDIIPRKGLPIVGLVLVALIAAVAADRLWALEFFHVAGGGMWTALDLFLGFILGPILRKVPVPTRIQVQTRLMPKMLLIMPTLVVCTLTSGWQLGRHFGWVNSGYYNHGWVVASYIVVGVIAIAALATVMPANIAVLFELKKPRPNPEIIATLSKRFFLLAGIIGAMQVAILLIMTKLATG